MTTERIQQVSSILNTELPDSIITQLNALQWTVSRFNNLYKTQAAKNNTMLPIGVVVLPTAIEAELTCIARIANTLMIRQVANYNPTVSLPNFRYAKATLDNAGADVCIEDLSNILSKEQDTTQYLEAAYSIQLQTVANKTLTEEQSKTIIKLTEQLFKKSKLSNNGNV